mmetsp:Transcript_49345/g.81948  ORF Transcript_49345/g.81948 Transcript_49345/m.81948 type:complete len:80 (+) Transcript_49345:184-423(+)
MAPLVTVLTVCCWESVLLLSREGCCKEQADLFVLALDHFAEPPSYKAAGEQHKERECGECQETLIVLSDDAAKCDEDAE